jgi:spermidine/putrescine-binding protein
MHGVLRQYTVDPKNVNEIVRRVSAEGLTFLKAIPGFVSWGLMDTGHGQMVTYSVYQGKTGTDESTKKAAAWIKENIASLVPNPPHVVEGEVRLRELKEKAKYGVVRRYQVDPKNIDKIVASAKSGFLPLVTHLPGFASYSIVDAGKGTLVTISGFTTPSGSAESTKAAAKYVEEHLAALVPNAPEVTSGEVKLLERVH